MAFETIEVDLSYDERMLLIRAYIKKHMLPESAEAFENELEERDSVLEAVFAAVVNDACVRALMEELSRQENQEEEDATEK